MKRKLVLLMSLMLTASMFTACNQSSGSNETITQSTTHETKAETDLSDTTEQIEETTEETETTTEQIETSEETTTAPLTFDIEFEDPNLYNTKDNGVPFGKWSYYKTKNYESGEYEPYYIRISRVSRDQTEVQNMLDSYTGIMDFTLSDDQARDIEYGLVEYEIYFAPDCTAANYGINIPRVSISMSPIETNLFKTADGTTYIGIGRIYDIESKASRYAQPGEIVSQKCIFSILKNYTEGEYVFDLSWYDGAIETENARTLYFASTIN